ncbi:MAG: heavy metal-associated domain-containing protein [Bacteroidota bacterium]
MKTVILAATLFVSLCAFSAEPEVREARFRVSGNCVMCKLRIEKALAVEGVRSARWDRRSQTVRVFYESPPLTADSLQRIVAASGHDTGEFSAPDSVYRALPDCCRYREKKKTH